ncbi:sugar kinase [Maricaulis sp. W15]|uniref:sugar kinase n=1 Tax=Maricaulis sp. W15 TaxID=1772333 RepID=UPI00094911F8|nr:sugar kinase [Maricaulis sp. W15]OLF71023.1 sugar kinase [Maricaulis sp. W15]
MTHSFLPIKPAGSARWDVAALGEVMLRLDPGEGRVRNTRHFQVWEGGGEYNLARAARKCFGLSATVVTALPRNDVGWLVEDCICQGGVDASHILWRDFDGIGRDSRVGLNFVERGFGLRPALGVSDRGHSAASAMKPGDVDWDTLFGAQGVRWFHTGGIFAALSDSTAALTVEAVTAARKHGAVVSFDLNYRASLWASRGGSNAARALNRTIAPHVDVLFGAEGLGDRPSGGDPRTAIESAVADFPNLRVVATTCRTAHTANSNDWSAIIHADGQFRESRKRPGLDILDRVGGGDAFASGVCWALMAGKTPAEAVEYGAAHGALAMTTPGDASMARLDEIERAIDDSDAGVIR